VIESGISFIMGGGELHMLPVGTTGRHVTAELDAQYSTGDRAIQNRPQENLIERAQELGYTLFTPVMN
jgi:glycerophosphoryl diester phosphodiesterase